MKIYNGICFKDFSSILNNLERMAKNNIKMNNLEGVYSYKYYSKNFYELLKDHHFF